MAPVFEVIPVGRPIHHSFFFSANIYLHVESMFFFKALNNAEINILCNDGIKLHNFRIDVDTALLSTCSIFPIKPSEMAVALRRKT